MGQPCPIFVSRGTSDAQLAFEDSLGVGGSSVVVPCALLELVDPPLELAGLASKRRNCHRDSFVGAWYPFSALDRRITRAIVRRPRAGRRRTTGTASSCKPSPTTASIARICVMTESLRRLHPQSDASGRLRGRLRCSSGVDAYFDMVSMPCEDRRAYLARSADDATPRTQSQNSIRSTHKGMPRSDIRKRESRPRRRRNRYNPTHAAVGYAPAWVGAMRPVMRTRSRCLISRKALHVDPFRIQSPTATNTRTTEAIQSAIALNGYWHNSVFSQTNAVALVVVFGLGAGVDAE